MSPAVRNSVWFTFCNFLQRGLSFLTVPVFTRLLTTEEYGICNVYFAWFEVFVLFTSLKIPYEGLNNGLIRYEEDKDGYTSSVMGLVMSLTAVMFGIYHLVNRWIDPVTGLDRRLMLLMFVQLMFQPALMLWTNRQRFDFEYRKPVIVTVLSTVLNLVVTVLAVLNTSYKAEARIGGFVIVQSLFGMVSAVVLLVRGKTFYKKEYWKFALGFNLPLIFYYISQMVMGQSDRILINYFEGSGKAAVYGVAYSAATIVQLAISSVNGSLYPWIYKKLKEKKVSGNKEYDVADMHISRRGYAAGRFAGAGYCKDHGDRRIYGSSLDHCAGIGRCVFFIPVHAVRERGNVLWRKQRDFSDLCFVFCGEYCSEFCGDSGVWILCGGMGEFIFLHAPGFAALSPDEADLQSTSYRRRNSG